MTLIHALPHVNLHAGKIALPKCFIVDSSVNDVVGLRHVRALDHPQVQRSDVRHRAGVLGDEALCQRSLPPLGKRLSGQRGIGGFFGIHDSTVSGRRPPRPAEPGNVVKRCRHADEARDIAVMSHHRTPHRTGTPRYGRNPHPPRTGTTRTARIPTHLPQHAAHTPPTKARRTPEHAQNPRYRRNGASPYATPRRTTQEPQDGNTPLTTRSVKKRNPESPQQPAHTNRETQPQLRIAAYHDTQKPQHAVTSPTTRGKSAHTSSTLHAPAHRNPEIRR